MPGGTAMAAVMSMVLNLSYLGGTTSSLGRRRPAGRSWKEQ